MGATRLRTAVEVGRRLRLVSRAEQRVRRAVLVRDLQRLHDVLATTALHDNYSVCGGLLLGWARDGKVMLEDVRDADFTYRAEDAAAFEQAAEALVRAGFTPGVRYVNNDGHPAIHRLWRHGARFEFFALWHRQGRIRYFMYDGRDELVCERADQDVEAFQFLRRVWLKPVDHEAALTANYGDWRRAHPDWHYAMSGTVIQRHRATFARQQWNPGGTRPSKEERASRT
jgi:hypothetical protein